MYFSSCAHCVFHLFVLILCSQYEMLMISQCAHSKVTAVSDDLTISSQRCHSYEMLISQLAHSEVTDVSWWSHSWLTANSQVWVDYLMVSSQRGHRCDITDMNSQLAHGEVTVISWRSHSDLMVGSQRGHNCEITAWVHHDLMWGSRYFSLWPHPVI